MPALRRGGRLEQFRERVFGRADVTRKEGEDGKVDLAAHDRTGKGDPARQVDGLVVETARFVQLVQLAERARPACSGAVR